MGCLFKYVNERRDGCNVFDWPCVFVCLVLLVDLSNLYDFLGPM